MNKITRIFFCACFCFFPQHNFTSPLLDNMPTIDRSFLSTISFENIQKLIYDHPKLSLAITTAFISIIGCTSFLLSKYKKTINSNIPSKAEIHYTADTSSATLMLTTPGKTEPYCYNNLHSYEISPQGNFILARQLAETSAVSAIAQAFFGGLGAYSIIQNLLRCSAVYHIIDMTGTIILSLNNAQQCSFSKNEKYLLIREIKPISKFEKLYQLCTKTKPLPVQKDISRIQYKIIDLTTKKVINIFENVFSVTFSDKNDSIIITDAYGNIKFLKPRYKSTFFAKRLCFLEVEHKNNTGFVIPITKFYLDGAKQTYCLDIQTPGKPLHTIEHVKTYVQHNNHLLINTDPHEHQKLQGLQEVTFTTLIGTIQTIISIIQKPQFNAQIFSLVSGKKVDVFHYINPIMCSFTDQNAVLTASIISHENPILYKNFNLSNYVTSVHENGKAIMFTACGPCMVVDSNNATCTLKDESLTNLIQENFSLATKGIHDEFEQLGGAIEEKFAEMGDDFQAQAQNLLAHITAAVTTKNTDLTRPSVSIFPEINDKITYGNYQLICKKLSICDKSQTNYLKHVQDGINGLEWNIHVFSRDKFNTVFNNLEGYPLSSEGHICISHLAPKDMKYTQYQSLTNELKNILEYMKNNTQAIISIFLTSNDCPSELIDKEIMHATKEKKYDPLLTSHILAVYDKSLETLTIADMIKNNNRLMFFCDKNTETTLPFSCSSKYITYV